MTTLLLMGAQGSAMIVAVLVLRALLLDRLPKATFCALWVLVAARLLVPFFAANPLGLWGLASRLRPLSPSSGEALGDAAATATGVDLPGSMAAAAASLFASTAPTGTGGTAPSAGSSLPPATGNSASPTTPDAGPSLEGVPEPAGVSPLPVPTEQAAALPQVSAVDPAMLDPNSAPATPADLLSAFPWWTWAWIAGSVLCLLGFAALYLHGRLRFKASAPVDCPQAARWLQEHPLRRHLSIRRCPAVSAPLTYGVLHPVILVPPAFDWSDSRTVDLVLAHEYAHVVRLDALWKLVLVLAVCVHWFNPLVWVMYVVANRDVELSCDARVARRLLPGQRASYARMLLEASDVKDTPIAPLASAFAKSSIEERVVSVMKYRPTSWSACIVSAAVLIAVPAALATSAPAPSGSAEPAAVQTGASSLAEGATPGIAVEGRPITSHEYSDEEWDALEMLYRYARLGEPLTSSLQSGIDIGSFRRAIPAALDGLDAEDLLARLASDGWLQRQINSNTMATFLELALVPLASDDWESYEFVGARSVGEPVQGILTFSFSWGYDPKTIEALNIGGFDELEYLPMGYYLAVTMGEWANLSNLLDSVDPTELSSPDRVLEIIDTHQIPSIYGSPYQGRNIDARYSYQALADDGSWQESSLVGTVHVVFDVDNPGNPPKEYEHGLEAGTLDIELSPDAVNPLATNLLYLNYESLGITRDPITGKLFYEGQPVRLFIDGYTGGAPGAQADQVSFYYTDPEGVLDLRTEFDYFGYTPIDSPVGQAFQNFRTPIYGIVEMDEEEAHTVAEFFSPLYEQVYPVHTAEELYGPSAEGSDLDAAFDTNLPIVSSLLAMEPSQLLGYLEDNGYTYDEGEKAFRKDGGVFGSATTGTFKLTALGEPDELGYRQLSPDQLRAGEPVEAITVGLSFDPASAGPAPTPEEALAIIDFLQSRENLEGGVSQGPVTEIPAAVFDAMAYQADGKEMIFSTYLLPRGDILHHIELCCSSVDYLAEAYHVDATLEGLADGALWLAPYYTNPEVAAMLESQGR